MHDGTSRLRRTLALVCLLAVGSSCTDPFDPPTALPAPAVRLVNLTPLWTLGVAGTEVSVAVRVIDRTGAPISGERVRFEVVAGGGRVEGVAAISDDSGIAREWWVLGDEPGTHILVAATDASPRHLEFRVSAQRPCPSPCAEARRLAFVRAGDIYAVDADGSNLVQLTSTGTFGEPAWSPDGRVIAFTDLVLGEILLMHADGSGFRRFASGTQPAWSPDGEWIAYSALHLGNTRIFIKSLTTGEEGAIGFDRGYNHAPAWSPSGDRIAFVSDWAAFDFAMDVYLVNPDGSDIVQVTAGFSGSSWTVYEQPAWSPDGGTLAVISCPMWEYFTCASSSVGFIPIDGGGFQLLAQAGGLARPSWTPDGSAIAFARTCWNHDCDSDVYIVDAPGGDRLLIPDAHSPAWRR